jgi:DNA-binding beta-propeller fold protein YncE
VVVNSVEVTLTVFATEDPTDSRTVDLEIPEGTPVGVSTRGELAVVPLGVWPAAVVVDLEAGAVTRAVPLPSGSGATGSIFLTDSTALVANPGRGSVTRVNVLRGTTETEVAVGTYPQFFVETAGKIVVVDSRLVDFEPSGPGTLVVLDPESLAVEGTVTLSGENSGRAVAGPGSLLYVLNGGRFGTASGSLSVVDLDLMEEVAHHEGFGEFPQGLVLGGDGRLYVSSWSLGVLSWDPELEGFHRGPDDPVTPGGVGSASGLGVDGGGRLHTLFPDCEGPSKVLRLGTGYAVEGEVPVGICPTALAFTVLGAGDG